MAGVKRSAEKAPPGKMGADQRGRPAKALGHPARIEILRTLLNRQTFIGCDLAGRVGLAASTTAEHLRILKDAGPIRGAIAHGRVCCALAPLRPCCNS